MCSDAMYIVKFYIMVFKIISKYLNTENTRPVMKTLQTEVKIILLYGKANLSGEN